MLTNDIVSFEQLGPDQGIHYLLLIHVDQDKAYFQIKSIDTFLFYLETHIVSTH